MTPWSIYRNVSVCRVKAIKLKRRMATRTLAPTWGWCRVLIYIKENSMEYRTHNNGELRIKNVGESVTLSG